jgi:hypothetical protein
MNPVGSRRRGFLSFDVAGSERLTEYSAVWWFCMGK